MGNWEIVRADETPPAFIRYPEEGDGAAVTKGLLPSPSWPFVQNPGINPFFKKILFL